VGIITIQTSENKGSNITNTVFKNPVTTPLHVYWYKMWQVSKLNERFLALKGFKNVNKTLHKTNALVPSQVYLSGTVTLKMLYDGYRQ
jgi:hypothetical protein